MDMDNKITKHVSHLARIEIQEKEVEVYSGHLKNVLEYMGELNEVDTKEVEPLVSPLHKYLDLYQHDEHLRKDQVETFDEHAEIIKNAPAADHGQYKVNAVLDESS